MGLSGEVLTKEIVKERKNIVQMERREGLRRDSMVGIGDRKMKAGMLNGQLDDSHGKRFDRSPTRSQSCMNCILMMMPCSEDSL